MFNKKFFTEGYWWTKDETKILIKNFNAGKTPREITIAVNDYIKNSRPGTVKTFRTVDSIVHKLKNLGMISEKELSDILKAKRVLIDYNRLNNYDDNRNKVFERDGNKCAVCGVKENLQLAHVVPFRETLKTTPEELIALCRMCHRIFDSYNEFETKKIFDYMCKKYSDYEKKYKITYRYNPVTNRDLAEIKRI